MIIHRILLKLSRRRQFERDMESELAFHRELARENGNPIGLGNVTRVQEEARDLWRFSLLEDFWRDVLYAVRSLRCTPGFAAIAILTLALGIGANTAIFTLIHRVMLASLPVLEPAQLIELLVDRGGSSPAISFSYQSLQDFRARTKVCSSIIGFSSITFHALIDANPMERLSGLLVTGDYFSALGVTTPLGRPIVAGDDRTGAGNAVAVISHDLWRGRFGSDRDVLGKTVVLENVPFTIIGVAPAGFHGAEVGRRNDVWAPIESERMFRRPSSTSSPSYKWLQILGRLKPGTTMDQARAELGIIFRQSVIDNELGELQRDGRLDALTDKQLRNWSLLVGPAATGLSRTREQYEKPLLVLMTIVGVLLLIACTNVANLLFARALAREREIALRLSLGAGRRRLIRQLLTESFVLVAAGGALGVFTAYLLTKYLTDFLASANALALDISPNAATLAFTAAISVLTVALFGLMPAFRSTDIDFATRLKGSAQGWLKAGSHRWSGALIVVQVALLLVLILGAGLFVRTLHNLNSIDLGFDRSNVLLVVVDPFGTDQSSERLMPLSEQLLDRIEALPGVKAASLTRFVPISGGSGVNLDFVINREGAEPRVDRGVWVNNAGPKYFETMRIPLIAGREFGPQDSAKASRVVIVNQSFAERNFGTASPIGKTISNRRTGPLEIIGLVGNAKYSEIRAGIEPTVYNSLFQQFGAPLQFVIRTERAPETIAAAVRAEVRSVIGNVLVRERTLENHIDASIVRERLVTNLAALFGGLALLLAVIGLYGVVSNRVARRTKEIGIRIALGFDRRSAVSMVLREVFVLVGGGIVFGLPLAIVVNRQVAPLLYGLSPDDPSTMLASVCALLLSAFAAGFIPARRASQVDPMVALRDE